MPIQTTCPKCSARFTMADNLAGKKARCKNCKAVFVVPDDDVPTLEEVDEKITASPRSRPRPNVAPAPAARRPAPSRRDEEDDRPSRRKREEDDDRPARRKEPAAAATGNNTMLLVGGGVACAGARMRVSFNHYTPDQT